MSKAETAILSQLYNASDTFSDWRSLELRRASAIHIAVMSEPFLFYVFEGKKTVESRFSLHRIAPYQKVQPGDLVMMKHGPIVGSFRVEWARYFDLQEQPIDQLIDTYDKAICGNKEFWQTKSQKRYVTLIGIEDVTKLSPVAISKTDRRAWMVLAHNMLVD